MISKFIWSLFVFAFLQCATAYAGGLNLAKGVVSSVPVNTALPAIRGTAAVGETLVALPGSWTNPDHAATSVDGSYALVFDEEFNGSSLDHTKWNENFYGTLGQVTPPTGGSNSLAADDPAQITIAGGFLALTTINNPITISGTTYTYRTGHIDSNPATTVASPGFEVNPTAGNAVYFESRIYIPPSGANVANWPAFWTSGHVWPQEGEIDIAEAITDGSGNIGMTASYHSTGFDGFSGVFANKYTGWHVFAAKWTTSTVTYYYDGVQVKQYTTNIMSYPNWLLVDNNMNTSVAGPNLVPASLLVDYVHAYKQGGSAVTAQSNYGGSSAYFTGYTYQWNRAGTPISGATAATYVPVSGDAGSALTVSVVATNATGPSSAATSAGTSAVTGGSGTCPQGTATADGCGAGVAGTPNNPTLLSSYGANRPPWNVAGVDYKVGHSGSLSNPATGGVLPACASYSAGAQNTVTVNSAPCTIDHLDFASNNGVCLNVAATSGALTVTNNNFAAGSKCQPAGGGIISIPGGSNVSATIRYNTFDVAYNNNFSNILNLAANGDRTVEYNAFLHADQHDIAFQGTGAYVVRYNYAFGTGCCGNHGDWYIFNNASGTTFSLNEAFNTVSQDPAVAGAAAGATALCYMATNTGVTLTSAKCNNDTYISQLGTDGLSHVSYPIRVEPAGTWSPGPFEVKDNWVRFDGSIDWIQGTSAGGTAAITCTGNKDLLTGATLTGTFGGFFTCTDQGVSLATYGGNWVNAFNAAVANGSYLVTVPAGTWPSPQIVPPQGMTIRGAGAATTFVTRNAAQPLDNADPPSNSPLMKVSVTNVTITDLTLRGWPVATSLSDDIGISGASATNLTVKRVNIENMQGIGVQTQGATGAMSGCLFEDVNITNTLVRINGFHGVALWLYKGTSNCTYRRVTINGSRNSGIQLDAGTSGSIDARSNDNNTFIDTVLLSTSQSGSSLGAVLVTGANNNTFTNTTVTNTGANSPAIAGGVDQSGLNSTGNVFTTMTLSTIAGNYVAWWDSTATPTPTCGNTITGVAGGPWLESDPGNCNVYTP